MKDLSTQVLKILSLLAFAIIFSVSNYHTQAQNPPRDYAIENLQITFTDALIVINVDLVNNGGDAVRETTASLINIGDGGRILAETTVPIILADETRRISFELQREDLPPATELNLRVEAGVDLYELAGTQIARDNIRDFNLATPAEDEVIPDAPTSDETPLLAFSDGGIIFNNQPYTYEELLPFVGIGAVALVLLWLVTIIFRLIFSRPPTFGTWQPPYTTVPTLHPDSVAGRRQAWQQHAQNGLILAPPHEGTPYAVKNLLSEDGHWLQGWQVIALRCAQYDQYGRVTRTQYIAPKSVLKQINRLMPVFGTPQFDKRLTRLTRTIGKSVRKQFGKKNLFLPVAVDMRWEGLSANVKVQFQLYQAQSGQWVRLDEWQPQMMVMPSRFQEQTTYTIHGQTSGETHKEYFQRLEHDMHWLFSQTFNPRLPTSDTPTPARQDQRDATLRHYDDYDVPDTLSNMQPVDPTGVPPQTPTAPHPATSYEEKP